jgi:hypothetical protein
VSAQTLHNDNRSTLRSESYGHLPRNQGIQEVVHFSRNLLNRFYEVQSNISTNNNNIVNEAVNIYCSFFLMNFRCNYRETCNVRATIRLFNSCPRNLFGYLHVKYQCKKCEYSLDYVQVLKGIQP